MHTDILEGALSIYECIHERARKHKYLTTTKMRHISRSIMYVQYKQIGTRMEMKTLKCSTCENFSQNSIHLHHRHRSGPRSVANQIHKPEN